MLKNLSIKNVALIKRANIDFEGGLNVLSGETGSGKSVVLEALNFALGQKADKTMITYGETDCQVSCEFDVSNLSSVKRVLEELDIEVEDEIIIKRTLNVDGKTSIRLNGESVTATMLRRVTSLLVDVHGQSDHFVLLKEANQLSMLDSLNESKISAIKREICDQISCIKEIDNNLASLGGNAESRAQRLDYLDYCIKEIERSELKEGEEDELILRKKKVLNAEKINLCCSEAVLTLTGDNGVSDLIGSVGRKISALTQISDEYSGIAERLENVLDEVNDLSEIINDSVDNDYDENELDFIESRLSAISLLKKKYGKTVDEILSTCEKFKKEYDLISDSSHQSAKLVEARSKALNSLNDKYDELTKEREKVAEDLCGKLSAKLKELAMKGAEFRVDFLKLDGEILSANGRDSVCFMFTANKGEALKPLSKVISGGELSRLMLAVKSVTGGKFGCNTFIFDEIDVGISGDTALVVAENFAKISSEKQIIAISHLPQIISMADVGFLISKKEEGDRTVTSVDRLNAEGKIGEVVRLVGGSKDSSIARAHAIEMIDKAETYKKLIN